MQTLINRFVASASEITSSDLYMTVKALLLTAPSPNMNGVACTEAFLDEIVAHQERYIGLPLCADMTKLENGLYRNLGHCYNQRTRTYSSSMIGSFYRFEKEEIRNGEQALIGYARILKRNSRVCRAIHELYENGALKFSFEITSGEYDKLPDGTIRIDASEKNFLEGAAIVTMPACPDAVALELVAEITGIGKEAEPMTEDEKKLAETAEQAEEAAKEMAETYVHQIHEEKDRVVVYDNETGVETETEVEVTQRVSGPSQEQAEAEAPQQNAEAADGEATIVAEADAEGAEGGEDGGDGEGGAENVTPTETPTETPVETPAEAGEPEADDPVITDMESERKRQASMENFIASMNAFAAEVRAQNEAMRKEIEEIKANLTQKVIAEEHQPINLNPFMAEMTLQDSGYRLLQEEKKQTSYRLLN